MIQDVASAGVGSGTVAIIVADDHDLVRIGMRELLRGWNPSVTVVEAADGPALRALLGDGRPWDLLVLDLAMPGFHPDADLCSVRQVAPDLPILIVSGNTDPAVMRRALDLGVAGFLPKATDGRLTLKAIELVLAGGRYVPAEALEGGPRADPAGTGDGAAGLLTQRQHEIRDLLLQGLPNKVIAARLNIAEATVKMHVTAILRAHGVQSRAALLAKIR